MKLKCLIIDDEPIARKILEEFIGDVEYLELAGMAENPVKAMPLLSKLTIDVIFLDINMPKMNGFEFLKCSENLPSIIVTTAYAEHAVEGFQLNVLDYLVKPISFDRFIQACAKVKKLHTNSKESEGVFKADMDHFFIKNNNSLEKIYYEDLLYVEGMLNYVVLHTVHTKMMVYVTIKSMLEQLPSASFIKVHKSYVVNISKINRIEGNIISIGSARISISQGLRDEVLNKIIKDRIIKR